MSPTDPAGALDQAQLGPVGRFHDATDGSAGRCLAALVEPLPSVVDQVDQYVEQAFPVVRAGALSSWTIGAHIDLYRDYVAQANMLARGAARPAAPDAPWPGLATRDGIARRLAIEANAIRLHEWYFQQLAVYRKHPLSQQAAVRDAMDAGFGSFDGWIEDVRKVSGTRGPGWVLAYWDARTQQLANGWIDLHELADIARQSVVFVLDLWEHAYWNDFGPEGRANYVDTILHYTDWTVVAQRFEAARAAGGAR